MTAQDKSIARKGAGIKRTTIRVERLILRRDGGKETSLVKATFKSFTGRVDKADKQIGLLIKRLNNPRYFKPKVEGLEKSLVKLEKAHLQELKSQAQGFYKINGLMKLPFEREDELNQWEVNLSVFSAQAKVSFAHLRKQLILSYGEKADASKLAKDIQLLVTGLERETTFKIHAREKLNQIKAELANIKKIKKAEVDVIQRLLEVLNDLWALEEADLIARLTSTAFYILLITIATKVKTKMERVKNLRVSRNEDDDEDSDWSFGVDYWTKPELSKIESELKKLSLQVKLLKNEPLIALKKLKQLFSEIVTTGLNHDSLTLLAVEMGLASKERFEVCERVIQALKAQGFELTKMKNGTPANAYLGGKGKNDDKEGVFAILRNPNMQIGLSVIVHTDKSLERNQLVFQLNREKQSDNELLPEIITKVKSDIETAGYELGLGFAPHASCYGGLMELNNPEALAKTGLSDNLKRRLGLNLPIES